MPALSVVAMAVTGSDAIHVPGCRAQRRALAAQPVFDVRLQNVVPTPHVAWASEGAMPVLDDPRTDTIERWADGRPQHRVT